MTTFPAKHLNTWIGVRSNIWHSKKVNASYVQDSFSISKKNVLRGLHYRTNQQLQLITLVRGKIFDVVVNINKKSPNYGKVFEYYLDENKNNQIILPKYYAHGFCVISEEAIINYKTDKYYNPKYEKGIIWNDKKLNINWPISKPIISKRDRLFGNFNDI